MLLPNSDRSSGRIAACLFAGLFLAAGSFLPGPGAGGHGEPGPARPVRVELGSKVADLKLLYDLNIDVDGVFDGWARAYVLEEELDKLQRLGFRVSSLPDEGRIGLERLASEGVAGGAPRDVPDQYHTYETLTADLQALAAAHPDLTRLISIGRSVQRRELWMLKITDNPELEEDEPGTAFISSIHGDEVVGKELCFSLISHLIDNYGTDPRVTELVNQTEIWILPSMNPDGTAMGQRWNAHNVDLNRDFPDQFTDPVNTPDGREPETGAVMLWGADHNTSLSTNFHGGEVIANYPFDGNPQGASVYSASPDDSVFVSIARSYADNNPTMFAQNDGSFDHGITNGADWYAINGGLQDWNYVWRGSFEVMFEISQNKWPAASQLPFFWDENLESMLSYLERVHEGIRGVVTDAQTGAPLAATVRVVGNDVASYTDPEVGDYHRIVFPGTYAVEVSAVGYSTKLLPEVVVSPGPAVRYDVTLEPLDVSLQPIDACADQGAECRGWLDPGENVDLSVTLRNMGLAATSIGAELIPTGWFATVTRPQAGYPDLLPGESGSSSAPHHGASISPAVPAGHKVGFALRWTAGEGSGTADPFFVKVGEPTCEVYPSSAVPVPISDHTTSVSKIVVPLAREIAGLTVSVDLNHSYIGELRVELVSPAGTPVALHNRTGGSANGISGTYGVDLIPAEPLSRIRGESSGGGWYLRVHDAVNGDQGSLDAWSLELCGRPIEAAPPEMRFREFAVEPGGVRLDWWVYPGLESYRLYRSTDPASPAAFLDVTAEDDDSTDTTFLDASTEALVYYLVTGVGPQGEGPKGHFGE